MKKVLLFFAIVVVVSAIAVLVLFRFGKIKVASPTPPPAAVTTPQAAAPPSMSPTELAELRATTDIKVLVKKFTEMYGSYSTDNKFENLENVKQYATPSMQAALDKIIADGQQAKEFFGVTTRLITTVAEDATAVRQIIRAKTQRQEVKSNTAPRTFYQDLVLTLVKSSTGWLVDQAKWQ